MIHINVKADVRQATKFLGATKQGVRRAAARAINDALITVRAEGAREIKASHPVLKISSIKENMAIHRATPAVLTGKVETKGRPLSMTLFGLAGGESSRRRKGARGQISLVRVKRPLTARMGKNRSVVQYRGRGAFRVLKYGNEVFVRTHAKGRQIRRFRGPSMPGVFRAKAQQFKTMAEKRWAITFPNRMKYEIELAKG